MTFSWGHVLYRLYDGEGSTGQHDRVEGLSRAHFEPGSNNTEPGGAGNPSAGQRR